LLDASGELTLCCLQLANLIFDRSDALLLGLRELSLQVEHNLGWTGYFKAVQIDEVSETKHLSFFVFTFLLLDYLVLDAVFFHNLSLVDLS